MIPFTEKYFSTNTKLTENQIVARDNFFHLGFPSRKNEDFKYTDCSGIYEGLSELNIKTTEDKSSSFSELNTPIFNENTDGLYQLNLSLTQSPEVFTINDDQTLFLTHLQEQSDAGVFYHRHYYIHVKSGAKLCLKQNWDGLSSNRTWFNTALTFLLEENAQVELLQTNTSNELTSVTQFVRVFAKKNSNFLANLIQLSGGFSRHNIYIDLQEAGANADTNGLYLSKGNEHVDCHLYVKHSAPHTTSSQLFKGILDDESKGVFTGKVRIEKNAQQVSAKQLNRNILLSKKAHMHSQPQLEVYADDVKASHGSATGQLDDDQLFYFQSRGLTPDKAKQMLGQAYGNEILLKINSKTWREEMQNLVFKRLG